MTYEPTRGEIDALCAHFEAEGYEAIDPHTARSSLIAAHAARPVPESALEIVRSVRDYEDATCVECGCQTAEPFFMAEEDAVVMIQSYADAARASDRALIEEAARDIDALLRTPEISDCDPRDKDTETQVVERNARATLAKLRSYGNAN